MDRGFFEDSVRTHREVKVAGIYGSGYLGKIRKLIVFMEYSKIKMSVVLFEDTGDLAKELILYIHCILDHLLTHQKVSTFDSYYYFTILVRNLYGK